MVELTRDVLIQTIADQPRRASAFVNSRAAAARLFEEHPHMKVFPCDGGEVMPVLGGD